MLPVSNAWKEAYTEMLSPETFIEIDLLMGRVLQKGEVNHYGYPIYFVAGGGDTWKESAYKLHKPTPIQSISAATLEENLWILDGTRRVMEAKVCENMGFCTNGDENLHFGIRWWNEDAPPETLPLMTIVWSAEYKEYPHSFEVKFIYDQPPPSGEGIYEQITLKSIVVENNNSYISEFPVDVAGYTRIEIVAYDWNTPNHRKRMDQVFLGKTHRFDKKEIISFTHEQSCDLLSATLPKNSITFSVNNLDGRWNPHNPAGDSKYLMERQAVSVRYGTKTSLGIEWIPGGTFFLSEWKAPSNGAECTFVARDVFEFLLRERITSDSDTVICNTSVELMDFFINEVGLVYSGIVANSDDSFTVAERFFAGIYGMVDMYTDLSVAENLQLIANANGRILHHNRSNQMCMTSLSKIICDYPMPLKLAYSYPEITLSKPLRDIVIKVNTDIDSDGDGKVDLKDKVVLVVRNDGESQTVDNRLMYAWSDTKLNSYAEWVRDTLVSRKIVSGEFRADPRLEVLDVLSVETKFGAIEPVALTTVKYAFNGSFRCYYEGRVISG
jgi:hypothetical protein